MNSMEFLLLACGCYWIMWSSTLNVKSGLLNKILFKILPFFTGIVVCLITMNMMGWVNIWQIQ